MLIFNIKRAIWKLPTSLRPDFGPKMLIFSIKRAIWKLPASLRPDLEPKMLIPQTKACLVGFLLAF